MPHTLYPPGILLAALHRRHQRAFFDALKTFPLTASERRRIKALYKKAELVAAAPQVAR